MSKGPDFAALPPGDDIVVKRMIKKYAWREKPSDKQPEEFNTLGFINYPSPSICRKMYDDAMDPQLHTAEHDKSIEVMSVSLLGFVPYVIPALHYRPRQYYDRNLKIKAAPSTNINSELRNHLCSMLAENPDLTVASAELVEEERAFIEKYASRLSYYVGHRKAAAEAARKIKQRTADYYTRLFKKLSTKAPHIYSNEELISICYLYLTYGRYCKPRCIMSITATAARNVYHAFEFDMLYIYTNKAYMHHKISKVRHFSYEEFVSSCTDLSIVKNYVEGFISLMEECGAMDYIKHPDFRRALTVLINNLHACIKVVLLCENDKTPYYIALERCIKLINEKRALSTGNDRISTTNYKWQILCNAYKLKDLKHGVAINLSQIFEWSNFTCDAYYHLLKDSELGCIFDVFSVLPLQTIISVMNDIIKKGRTLKESALKQTWLEEHALKECKFFYSQLNRLMYWVARHAIIKYGAKTYMKLLTDIDTETMLKSDEYPILLEITKEGYCGSVCGVSPIKFYKYGTMIDTSHMHNSVKLVSLQTKREITRPLSRVPSVYYYCDTYYRCMNGTLLNIREDELEWFVLNYMPSPLVHAIAVMHEVYAMCYQFLPETIRKCNAIATIYNRMTSEEKQKLTERYIEQLCDASRNVNLKNVSDSYVIFNTLTEADLTGATLIDGCRQIEEKFDEYNKAIPTSLLYEMIICHHEPSHIRYAFDLLPARYRASYGDFIMGMLDSGFIADELRDNNEKLKVISCSFTESFVKFAISQFGPNINLYNPVCFRASIVKTRCKKDKQSDMIISTRNCQSLCRVGLAWQYNSERHVSGSARPESIEYISGLVKIIKKYNLYLCANDLARLTRCVENRYIDKSDYADIKAGKEVRVDVRTKHAIQLLNELTLIPDWRVG